MTGSRAGTVAVRAVNQYRRRDPVTYLALRYYLDSTAARADYWAQTASTELVLSRSDPVYFRALHFKDIDDDGRVEHRRVFLPGANEALAEAALLDQCSTLPEAFANPACVFSYELSRGDDRLGVFQPYFGGLQRRHQAVAEACDACPKGIVRCTDIRRFYPSITTDVALAAWREQADVGHLSAPYRDLGEKLIKDHDKTREPNERGILTGPMFSHLLGNLILRQLDIACSSRLPARYFRYVDDITLVGEQPAVSASMDVLSAHLAELDLELHDDSSSKNYTVGCSEWLEGRNDFRETLRPISWMTFVGDLKQFLLRRPDQREALRKTFLSEGLRVPVRDYAGAIRETGYVERALRWARQPWVGRRASTASVRSLLGQALWLRRTYEAEFRELVDEAVSMRGFSRKRRIPKLRYRAARLVYVAAQDSLASLSSEASAVSELRFHAEVLSALSSGNLDRLLPMGTNAAQAVAQPLRAVGRSATATSSEPDEAEELGLAIFNFNGVPVARPSKEARRESDLLRLASAGVDMALMKSSNAFVRELACLHGFSERPRHPDILETAFDEDEILSMDAIDQIQQSLSP